LWAMRRLVFGLGSAQIHACGIIIGVVARAFDNPVAASVVSVPWKTPVGGWPGTAKRNVASVLGGLDIPGGPEAAGPDEGAGAMGFMAITTHGTSFEPRTPGLRFR